MYSRFDGDAWSADAHIAGSGLAGAPSLTVNSSGNIAVVYVTGFTDINNLSTEVATWPNGATDWSAPTTIGDAVVSGMTHVPRGVITDDGDVAAVWAASDDNNAVNFSVGDQSGPELNDLSVPTSGVTDQPLDFAVNPFDVWSALGTTTWSFGDGSTSTDANPTHTYSDAGSYPVRVTASDALGNTSTSTSTVTIAAPPEQRTTTTTVTKPTVYGPKPVTRTYEALLSGKTITVNAVVKVRAHKGCSGKVSASMSLGASYRMLLTLKKSGSVCRASGRITLRTAPKASAKVRVGLSGKQITARTLTAVRK